MFRKSGVGFEVQVLAHYINHRTHFPFFKVLSDVNKTRPQLSRQTVRRLRCVYFRRTQKSRAKFVKWSNLTGSATGFKSPTHLDLEGNDDHAEPLPLSWLGIEFGW